jgi:hypothetical protein
MFLTDSLAAVIVDRVIGFTVSVPDGTIASHQKDEEYRSIYAKFTNGDGDTVILLTTAVPDARAADYGTADEIAKIAFEGSASVTKHYPIAIVKQTYRGRAMYVATYPVDPSDKQSLMSSVLFIDRKNRWHRQVGLTILHVQKTALTDEQLVSKLDELKLDF